MKPFSGKKNEMNMKGQRRDIGENPFKRVTRCAERYVEACHFESEASCEPGVRECVHNRDCCRIVLNRLLTNSVTKQKSESEPMENVKLLLVFPNGLIEYCVNGLPSHT